ncbi:MAG: MFS transporter [Cyanothece sp. SIO2G6]|nr:MFS transporter [Cyanothece sp. SIO2G6]
MKTITKSALSFKTKLFYGIGAASGEIYGITTGSFFLFFLTTTVGLNPTLASTAFLIGKIWDGINDPLIGWLSDRTTTSASALHASPFIRWLSPFITGWGRRYPWMILGAIPLGIAFFLQWIVPPFSNPSWLFIYYTVVILVAYTAITAVLLPYSALAAEITKSYDERTSLMSFRSFFAVVGLLGSLMLAQAIFGLFADAQQQYLVLGLIEGLLIIGLIYLCIWGTRKQYRQVMQERQTPPQAETLGFFASWRTQLGLLWRSRPLQIAALLILSCGMASNLTISVLPYFIRFVLRLPDHHITQALLAVQGFALLAVFGWNQVSQWVGKRGLLFLGLPIWLLAHLGLFFVSPGRVGMLYLCASAAGTGFATALLAPWSMLPDIIDLDELNTGKRREGMFYGVIVQAHKLALALAIFGVGRLLDISGFVTPEDGIDDPLQPTSVLWAIRILIAIVPVVMLAIALCLTYIYPLTREVHQEIALKLQTRNES